VLPNRLQCRVELTANGVQFGNRGDGEGGKAVLRDGRIVGICLLLCHVALSSQMTAIFCMPHCLKVRDDVQARL